MSTKTEEPTTIPPGRIQVEPGPYSSRNGERQLPAASPAAANLTQALATAAMNPNMDVAKIERLWAMQKDMMDREREAAFNDAMARAQSRIEPVARDRRNDHTKSMYATLAAINDAIVPIYAQEGLSVSFDTYDPVRDKDLPPLGEDMVRVIAFCSHSGGHTRKYHLDGGLDDAGMEGKKNKTPIQAMGSTVSYLRRYLVCMIFNVSTEDDDDGNPGTSGGAKLTDKERADFLALIDEAESMQALMTNFANAYNKAAGLKDQGSMKLFLQHRDLQKKKIEAKEGRARR